MSESKKRKKRESPQQQNEIVKTTGQDLQLEVDHFLARVEALLDLATKSRLFTTQEELDKINEALENARHHPVDIFTENPHYSPSIDFDTSASGLQVAIIDGTYPGDRSRFMEFLSAAEQYGSYLVDLIPVHDTPVCSKSPKEDDLSEVINLCEDSDPPPLEKSVRYLRDSIRILKAEFWEKGPSLIDEPDERLMRHFKRVKKKVRTNEKMNEKFLKKNKKLATIVESLEKKEFTSQKRIKLLEEKNRTLKNKLYNNKKSTKLAEARVKQDSLTRDRHELKLQGMVVKSDKSVRLAITECFRSNIRLKASVAWGLRVFAGNLVVMQSEPCSMLGVIRVFVRYIPHNPWHCLVHMENSPNITEIREVTEILHVMDQNEQLFN
jgi:hypothetical protein